MARLRPADPPRSLRGQRLRAYGLLIALLLSLPAQAELPTLRVAVLKFGTVNWELATLQAEAFDRQNGFRLEILPLASQMATQTAFQAGNVDLIVADWLWVARRQSDGERLRFLPYSRAIGKLMLPLDSRITQLADLAGKRLGIAGGPLSKGWLLLQAVARQRNIDLSTTQLQFGAPPLLNAALQQGQLDALLTFWHYAARLEADSYSVLVDLSQMSRELGLTSELPMLGYVFDQRLAEQQPTLVTGFAQAVQQARHRLQADAASWDRIRPLMRAENERVFNQLRSGYLAGTPSEVGTRERADAQRLFQLLTEIGGSPLIGQARALDPEIFWSGS